MKSNKLQRRVGGTRICRACAEFEKECLPYIYLLQKRGSDHTFVLKPPTITLFESIAELEVSGQRGCDICRIWLKALINECHSKLEEEKLFACGQSVRLQPPATMAAANGFDIRILTPVQTSVKRLYVFVRRPGTRKPITRDDVEGLEKAKREGTLPGRARPAPILNAKIDPDTSSASLWEGVSYWLKHCTANHAPCALAKRAASLPTRLIHICGSATIKVIDTTGLSPETEYAALSYAWGGDQKIKLTSAREEELRTGLPQDAFDATIKDTFQACQRLQIQYVWIDALCIRQDDGGRDFEQEAQKMGDIYGFAKLTLVIASAQSAREGFLHARRLEQHAVDARRTDFADGQLSIQRKGLDEVRARSPLALRGWCFQEELLSRRLLYCTSHGMFWSCSLVQLAEHGNHLNFQNEGYAKHQSVSRVLDPHSFINSQDRLYLWDSLIDQYSSRTVSFAEDRLPAVSGLAKSIEQETGEQFLFGMWKSRLPVQLLWTILDSQLADVHDQQQKCIQPKHSMPSWSWASTPPSQAVKMPSPEISHTRAKVLEIGVYENTSCLELQGMLRPLLRGHKKLAVWPPGSDMTSNDIDADASTWAVVGTKIIVQEEGRDAVEIQLDQRLNGGQEHLMCFQINYKGLLLLMPAGQGIYKRVGCSQLHNDVAFFVTAESVTVKLI